MKKDYFLAWPHLMRLNLYGVGDFALYYLDNEYIEARRPITILQIIKEKKKHNQMMIDLTSSLSYVEFDDVKDCTTTKKMWDKLAQILEGDKNVLRDKAKSLRGKFDDMRIEEGEIISQYCGRIK